MFMEHHQDICHKHHQDTQLLVDKAEYNPTNHLLLDTIQILCIFQHHLLTTQQVQLTIMLKPLITLVTEVAVVALLMIMKKDRTHNQLRKNIDRLKL